MKQAALALLAGLATVTLAGVYLWSVVPLFVSTVNNNIDASGAAWLLVAVASGALLLGGYVTAGIARRHAMKLAFTDGLTIAMVVMAFAQSSRHSFPTFYVVALWLVAGLAGGCLGLFGGGINQLAVERGWASPIELKVPSIELRRVAPALAIGIAVALIGRILLVIALEFLFSRFHLPATGMDVHLMTIMAVAYALGGYVGAHRFRKHYLFIGFATGLLAEFLLSAFGVLTGHVTGNFWPLFPFWLLAGTFGSIGGVIGAWLPSLRKGKRSRAVLFTPQFLRLNKRFYAEA